MFNEIALQIEKYMAKDSDFAIAQVIDRIAPSSGKVGDKAINYFDLISDTVYDISLTPNRADAASHLGVARDIKASQKREIILSLIHI